MVALENSLDKFARTSAWGGGKPFPGPAPACLHLPSVPQYQRVVTGWLCLTHHWYWRKVALLAPENAPEKAGAPQDDCQRHQVDFHASKKGVIPCPGSREGSLLIYLFTMACKRNGLSSSQ